jgi:hypothetical protein
LNILPNKNKNTTQDLRIGQDTIKRVISTKFLGLHIDEQLRWTEHIKYVKNKLSSSLYAIRSAKNILKTNQLKTLYTSMFQPYLEYGILLWGSASRSSLKTIEIMQKKALRVITNSTYNAHTDPI